MRLLAFKFQLNNTPTGPLSGATCNEKARISASYQPTPFLCTCLKRVNFSDDLFFLFAQIC